MDWLPSSVSHKAKDETESNEPLLNKQDGKNQPSENRPSMMSSASLFNPTNTSNSSAIFGKDISDGDEGFHNAQTNHGPFYLGPASHKESPTQVTDLHNLSLPPSRAQDLSPSFGFTAAENGPNPPPEHVPRHIRVLRFLHREIQTILLALVAEVLILVLFATSWSSLGWDASLSVHVTLLTMILLIRGITEPEVALFVGTTILLFSGIIGVDDAFIGFSNSSVVTIGLMLIIVSAVEDTGALTFIARAVLQKPSSIWSGQLRLMLFVAVASAFMNNTPLVAVMIPVVENWTRNAKFPTSLFMIPLSYSAIVGGLCTIIGTSTNLIVKGLAQDDYPDLDFPFFEVGLVGVPISLACIIYCIIFSRWLLPTTTVTSSDVRKAMREYTISLCVLPESTFVGETIRDGGLRNLGGLYLVEIERENGEVIPAPEPDAIVYANDKLTFSGPVDGIKSAWKTKGLVPVFHHASNELENTFSVDPSNEVYHDRMQKTGDLEPQLESPLIAKESVIQIYGNTSPSAASSSGLTLRSDKGNKAQKKKPKKKRIPRVLVEVVLAVNAPIVGRTVQESRFRMQYGAAILSVHRYGRRVEGRTAEVVLQGGDTLLLETTQKFLDEYSHHQHFALVSPVEGAVTIDPSRKQLYIASFLVVVMISLNVSELFELSVCALGCICVMYALGILKIHHVRRSLPSGLLLTISGAFGIAEALETTGVAERMGNNLVDMFAGDDGGGIGVLFAIYIATVILTSVLSNSAAVTLMYPIADQVAITAGYDQKAAFYTIMLAGSAAFSTPIGYQTNLMVCGPGGYEFRDYVRFGLPLQIIVMGVTVPLCAWFFG
eukprot:TRINITY_DN2525_c0_g13_i1.p1 TRINITY_DN2525_c0_g13~~TRINITY_DN2525_c0_g13_i1.p1  ORF type:complete len:832 (-),score=174.76 TRINITY_DN2525_c0_g13_i1:196-2691(-)